MAGEHLYHYTCDHGREAIGDRGELVHGHMLATDPYIQVWTGRYVWLTDMATPNPPEALGLTSIIVSCDRTTHRYRVLPEGIDRVVPYQSIRRHLTEGQRRIEQSPGARLKHWYVGTSPIPVVYDPEGCV